MITPALAQTTATWLGSTDGQWLDSSRWSTPPASYPRNTPSQTYQVRIDATQYVPDRVTGPAAGLTLAPGITVRTGTGNGNVGDTSPPHQPGYAFRAHRRPHAGRVRLQPRQRRHPRRRPHLHPPPHLQRASSPNGTIRLSGHAILNYTGPSPADAVRQQLALGRGGVTGILLSEAAAVPELSTALLLLSVLPLLPRRRRI